LVANNSSNAKPGLERFHFALGAAFFFRFPLSPALLH
jgi:hypothetical protein